MSNVNLKLNTGLMTFNFRDEDDNVFISFRINPADVNLAKRCEEVSAFFEKESANSESLDDISKFNALVEEKIDYLLGTQSEPVFKAPYTATTVLPDDRFLAEVVLETVIENVNEEMKKRKIAKKERLDKYTSKYEK